jgi:adenylosuccinate synthase
MHSCVVGLQWGDEAKGKIVDLLGGQHDIVVRFNGGANAGHTVVVEGKAYKLSLLPTGLVRREMTAIIGNGVVLFPPRLAEEVASLEAAGLNVLDRLKVSDRAHVIFPYHQEEERLREAASSDRIGTTGRGIGPCYADKVGRHLAVRILDLLEVDRLVARLREVVPRKNSMLAALSPEARQFSVDELVAEYRAHGDYVRPLVVDTVEYLHKARQQGKRMLFEAAQGSLLDIDHGSFPFVTSSNSTLAGLTSGSGFPARWLDQVIGVIKAYTTRVGGGPFPTELNDGPDGIGERIRRIGREYGTVTGRPRRCGWFDAVAARTTAQINGTDTVALMLLDVLSGLPQLKVATSYLDRGEQRDWFPADAVTLARCEPVYETLPGWEEDITGCRKWMELPVQARNYVRRVEQLVGVPIRHVSVGPDRAQTLSVE